MNKDYLPKSIGFRVQLRPVPRMPDGTLVDRDWILSAADKERLELHEPSAGWNLVLGTDHVYSFMTNPARDVGTLRHGFLLLLVQIFLAPGKIHIEPSPPPRSALTDPFVHQSAFGPLVVDDQSAPRYFSWRGRDPVHLIQREEPPRQLGQFYVALCDAIRQTGAGEPRFNVPHSLQGELVYEISSDFRARWSLKGGMGGAPGDQVLVLVTPNIMPPDSVTHPARAQLSEAATELLLTAAKDPEGEVHFVSFDGGFMILANARQFNDQSARSNALWNSALEELVTHQLLEDADGGGRVFQLSHNGFSMADRLTQDVQSE